MRGNISNELKIIGRHGNEFTCTTHGKGEYKMDIFTWFSCLPRVVPREFYDHACCIYDAFDGRKCPFERPTPLGYRIIDGAKMRRRLS